jgi:glycosyltransferase involved in cell wall biosynthesis
MASNRLSLSLKSDNSEENWQAMFVTIAICSFNRAESLSRTLDSLVPMRVPSDISWELLIINNNSTDHTDNVISEYIGRLPVRREFEIRAGKSNALNRAVDIAKGDYIIWMDDDVLVDAGLLTAYVEAFRRWPDAAVFGGRIKPRYEAPVKKWVIESEAVLGGPYAIRDLATRSDRSLPMTRTISPMERIGPFVQQSKGLFVMTPSLALYRIGFETKKIPTSCIGFSGLERRATGYPSRW